MRGSAKDGRESVWGGTVDGMRMSAGLGEAICLEAAPVLPEVKAVAGLGSADRTRGSAGAVDAVDSDLAQSFWLAPFVTGPRLRGPRGGEAARLSGALGRRRRSTGGEASDLAGAIGHLRVYEERDKAVSSGSVGRMRGSGGADGAPGSSAVVGCERGSAEACEATDLEERVDPVWVEGAQLAFGAVECVLNGA